MKHLHLIYSEIVLFLFADVGTDRSLVCPNCRYKISPGPEILAREVRPMTSVGSGNMNSRLALDVSNHLRYCILWRNRHQHMNMIPSQVPLQNFALSVQCQFSEHVPKIPPDIAINGLLPVFWNPNQVILALCAVTYYVKLKYQPIKMTVFVHRQLNIIFSQLLSIRRTNGSIPFEIAFSKDNKGIRSNFLIERYVLKINPIAQNDQWICSLTAHNLSLHIMQIMCS